MGSSATQWCDRCGKIVDWNYDKLTRFWFGQPSNFKARGNGVEAKCNVELCSACLQAVWEETKDWADYKENPK